MRINILTSIDKSPSAMNRQLLEYGNYLYSKGHYVSVLRPLNRGYTRSKKDAIEKKLGEIAYLISGRKIRYIRKLPWIEVKCPVKIIPSLNEKYISPCDITFFSIKAFLPSLEKLSDSYGKKVMRICSIFFAEGVKSLPSDIYPVANSSLIKQLLEERLGREVYLVVNGVNTKIFNNPFERKNPQTIGMFFYNKRPEHKGMEDGFWIMEQLHKRYPYLKFQVAGEWRERYIPLFVKFIDGRRIENLVNFYRSTDILIFPGKKDACPNPPMEAMACRCAVVTTEVGGISDYTVKDKSAIVVSPGDKEGILYGVMKLLENNDFFRQISEEGYKKIQEFSVEKQGEKLEKFFTELIQDK